MTSADTLMGIKVVLLAAGGAGFVWWQLHDLAQERRRTQERDKQRDAPQGSNQADEPSKQVKE